MALFDSEQDKKQHYLLKIAIWWKKQWTSETALSPEETAIWCKRNSEPGISPEKQQFGGKETVKQGESPTEPGEILNCAAAPPL